MVIALEGFFWWGLGVRGKGLEGRSGGLQGFGGEGS